MASNQLEAQLRAHIDTFVADLTSMIREATLQTMREALGAGTPTRRGPGRPKGSATKATKAPGAKKATRRKASRGGRRSAVDVEALATQIVDYVKSHPGCSVSDVGAALRLSTKDLQLPVRKLVAKGRLKTTGQRRGTRYHVGSGRAPAAKKARKAKKKVARRKSTKKSTVSKRGKKAA